VSADHVSDAVIAVCVSAPAAQWIPEVESTVLEKLNETVRAELGKITAVDRFTPGRAEEIGDRTEQTYSGQGTVGGRLQAHLDGRHVIAFAGDPPDVLVCTLACQEVTAPSARVCPSVVATMRLDGPFVPAPSPSTLARLGFAAVRRPVPAVGALVGLFMSIAGLLVAVWPAKKARRTIEEA
jgi:hypothetical protein